MSAKKAAKKTAKKSGGKLTKKAADETATNIAEESVTREATSAVPPEMPASPAQDGELTTVSPPVPGGASGAPKPPSRESVAALASRIVAAQITGIAHYETTASLWDEMLGALGAVVSSLEQNRDAKLTPEVLASALKSGLRRRWRRIPRPDVLGPVGFAGVEPLTDSAIRYAKNLLAPSRPRHVAEGSIVFAEQLFGVDETLSENGIVTRFNDFQWPKLSSPGSVRDILAALDEWFAEWIRLESMENGQVIQPPTPGKKLKDSTILVRALRILQGMDLEPGSDSALFAGAEDGLKAAIHKKTGFPVTELPRSEFRDMDWDLIDYFYCGEDPGSRLAKRRSTQEQESPSRGRKRKKKVDQMNYRPWGLFRYLRLYGEDNSARRLNAKLMVPRAELSTFVTPEALYNDLYEMHAIEQRVRRSEEY